ncbi:MAG TPA: phosphoglycerate kinase [Candidatus Nanoarchaeia archaeon]
MRSVKEADVAGKRVIVRCDFDVPVEDGAVKDRTRIEKNIETLKLLLQNQAKLFLVSHLGRPVNQDPNFSLKIVQPVLEERLSKKIVFQQDLESVTSGEIVLLENLRFWEEEEKNDLEFAKKLASCGEVFVFECFSAAHRAHASIATLPTLLPSYAGLKFEKEMVELERILKNPQHPLIAIIGGAKIETKLPAITNISKVADKVLVGGRLMFEIDKNNLSPNVVVASDHVDEKDIGPQTLESFGNEIEKAKMIVWNGPMGKYEEEKYRAGTLKLAEMVAGSLAYKIVGGGDTISALEGLGLLEKMDFVSVGGGAMLEFLSGKRLPALEALGYYK